MGGEIKTNERWHAPVGLDFWKMLCQHCAQTSPLTGARWLPMTWGALHRDNLTQEQPAAADCVRCSWCAIWMGGYKAAEEPQRPAVEGEFQR